jgi:hypothetical protein
MLGQRSYDAIHNTVPDFLKSAGNQQLENQLADRVKDNLKQIQHA